MSYLNSKTNKCIFSGPLVFHNETCRVCSLTKNHCISILHISSIYLIILWIQDILEPHDLKVHTHFWSCSSKNYWINFSNFLKFVSVNKISVYSINSSLRYSLFLSPVSRVATPTFDHAHSSIFNKLFTN